MVFCAFCGRELSEVATSCPQCGHPRGGPVAASRRTEGTAIASLILGIAGLIVCPLVPSIVAIILGNQAKLKLRADPSLEGEGLVRAGVVLGWIGVGIAILGAIVVVTFVVFGTRAMRVGLLPVVRTFG